MINSVQFAFLITAAMIIVGVTAPVLAQAQESINTTRSNIKTQGIAQEQEACTNEAVTQVADSDVVDIGGENSVDVEQSNDCDVTQTQTAANVGSIEDNSRNELRHDIVKNSIRNLPA